MSSGEDEGEVVVSIDNFPVVPASAPEVQQEDVVDLGGGCLAALVSPVNADVSVSYGFQSHLFSGLTPARQRSIADLEASAPVDSVIFLVLCISLGRPLATIQNCLMERRGLQWLDLCSTLLR